MKTNLSLSGLVFLSLVLGATIFAVQRRQNIGEIAQVYPPSVAPVSPSPSSPPATLPATPPPSLPPSPPATPTPSGLSVPTPIPTLGYILPTPSPVIGAPIIQATNPIGAVTQNNLSDWCRSNPDQCVADPAGFYRIMAGAAAPAVILAGALTAPLWGVAAIDAAIAAGPTITQVGFWTTYFGTGAGFAGMVGQTSTQIVYPVFSGKTVSDNDTPQIIKSIDYFSSIALYAGSGAAVMGQGIYSGGEQLSLLKQAKEDAYWAYKYQEAKKAVESTGAKVIDISSELEAILPGKPVVGGKGGYTTYSREIVLGEGFPSEQERLLALAHEYSHAEFMSKNGYVGWESRSLATFVETEILATGLGSKQVYAAGYAREQLRDYRQLLYAEGTGASYTSILGEKGWYLQAELNEIIMGAGRPILDPRRMLPANSAIINQP